MERIYRAMGGAFTMKTLTVTQPATAFSPASDIRFTGDQLKYAKDQDGFLIVTTGTCTSLFAAGYWSIVSVKDSNVVDLPTGSTSVGAAAEGQ
jgi:hypothetical protein